MNTFQPAPHVFCISRDHGERWKFVSHQASGHNNILFLILKNVFELLRYAKGIQNDKNILYSFFKIPTGWQWSLGATLHQ